MTPVRSRVQAVQSRPEIDHVAVAKLPTRHAAEPFDAHAFRDAATGFEHLVLLRGPLGAAPIVRLHSECLTGDALGSLRCDCGDQLRQALVRIDADTQGGLVIYLRGHEGRGIGLANKIRAYALQDRGLDTVEANESLGFPADARDFAVAAEMLRHFGLSHIRLLSNNPRKQAALEQCGVTIERREALRIVPNDHNRNYLATKRRRLGHDLAAE